MPSVTDCFYQCLRHIRAMAPITTVLRPLLYDIPVVTKNRVIPCAFESCNFQVRNSYQVFQIVCIAGIHAAFLGKIIPLCIPRDTGLQRTLYSIPRKIKRSIRQLCA